MQCYTIDPKALLGGIFHRDSNQELVQLTLQKGNETPPYQVNAIVLLVVLRGQIAVTTATHTLHSEALQVLRFEPNEKHSIRALTDDTTLLVVKQLAYNS